jgi:hypothetical protein
MHRRPRQRPNKLALKECLSQTAWLRALCDPGCRILLGEGVSWFAHVELGNGVEQDSQQNSMSRLRVRSRFCGVHPAPPGGGLCAHLRAA